MYTVLFDNNHAYFIKGMMSFNLNDLFNLCIRQFDLMTVINIGIDLIKTIKILYEKDFIHWDLKPDNLVFGCLCQENIKFKNIIGIIDFGNSKFLYNKKGSIIFSNNYMLRGNKAFSSNNALMDMDTTFNPLASPSAGAPALKYRYVNTETSSPGEAKGLIIVPFYSNYPIYFIKFNIKIIY